MQAVVLVGGEGTRLRPLTLTTPKQMLPVAGQPMIERVIGHLAGHGVDRVVLALGYRPHAFLQAYPDGRCGSVLLTYAVEDQPLDTAGAIAFAAAHAGITETFVVVNGDVLTALDVTALVAFHGERGAEATIALTPVSDPSAFGVVPTAGDGRVTSFIEKPSWGEAQTNLINAGTYICEPSVLTRIPGGRRVSIERETFPAMVDEGTLFAMASYAPWTDVGTPERYLEANLALGSTSGPGAGIDPSAVVEGSVIGAGCVVAGGARIERSVLLDGVRVGRDATVRGSIIGRDATIGEGASVDDLSVVGDGAEVGVGEAIAAGRLSS